MVAVWRRKNKVLTFILRLSPEGYEHVMRAGLLAYPVFEQPSHSEQSKQWQRMCQKLS